MATVRALLTPAVQARRHPLPAGGFLTVVALLLLLLAMTFGFPSPVRAPAVAPTFWPRLLILLLLATVVADRLATVRAAPDTAAAETPPRLVAGGPALAGIAFAAYWLGLHFLGFHVATPLFVAAVAPIFGLGRPWRVAALALASTLVIGITFAGLLYLPLPRGEIDVFYQLNAAIDGHLSRLQP